MLDLQGRTVEELADSWGRTDKYMMLLIQGVEPLNEDIARNLEATLGGSIEFWNNLEKHYRIWARGGYACAALRSLTDALDRCHVPYTVENKGRNVLFGGVFVTHTKWGFFRVLNGTQTYESNDITATIKWAFRHADDETRLLLGYP
jgi:plasmid maintenance system antidote protein VapI